MSADRLLLFGGAFDPPHESHQRILATAIERLGAARTLVVPCNDHAFKDAIRTPAEHRLAMAQLAFGELPGVEISRIEIDRPGVSFTVDTVRQLQAELGVGKQTSFWLLIGSDNVADLAAWKDHDSLLQLVTPVVYPRRGHRLRGLKDLQDVDIRVKHKQKLLEGLLDVPQIDAVNSTELRARIQAGEVPAEVPPAVADYVQSHGLYRSA